MAGGNERPFHPWTWTEASMSWPQFVPCVILMLVMAPMWNIHDGIMKADIKHPLQYHGTLLDTKTT